MTTDYTALPDVEINERVAPYLGIDPGKTGALALPAHHLVVDMPPSAHDLCDLLIEWDKYFPIVILERQQAFPHQGVTSSFTTGERYGMLQGVLAARGLPYRIVGASMWKRQLGLPADKELVRARARELFPWAELHLKKYEGRAHALMLAEWGRRFA